MTYEINDSTGNTVIDAGSDLVDARRLAQAHADRERVTTYLLEHGAEEDDYETFEPTKDEPARTYTYSIFDSNPASSSCCAWPGHDEIEIEAASDDEAVQLVRDELDSQASGLSEADGYEVGQTLYAQLTSSETCCIVSMITRELTAEDLS